MEYLFFALSLALNVTYAWEKFNARFYEDENNSSLRIFNYYATHHEKYNGDQIWYDVIADYCREHHIKIKKVCRSFSNKFIEEKIHSVETRKIILKN